MSAPQRVLTESTLKHYISEWHSYAEGGDEIRDLAIDLKNERRYSKELETQLELMTSHRNRLLDKREGHDQFCPACRQSPANSYCYGILCENAFHKTVI